MYKTAVYTLVNGGITHKIQQISKVDIARQYIDTLAMSRCVISHFWHLLFLMCNDAVNLCINFGFVHKWLVKWNLSFTTLVLFHAYIYQSYLITERRPAFQKMLYAQIITYLQRPQWCKYTSLTQESVESILLLNSFCDLSLALKEFGVVVVGRTQVNAIVQHGSLQCLQMST